jgi:hypothetical protein
LPTDRVGYNSSSARQGTFPYASYIDQRFNIAEDPVHSERIYWSGQQLPPCEGFPNPHGDQLAQEQSGEGALVDRQDSNLLAQGQSSRREVQSPFWDEFLNYAPGDSSSNTSLSPSQPTPLQSPSAMALSTRGTGLDVDSGSLDAWQNKAISDSMMVCTDSSQDINTVNPKDLLRAHA